MPDKKSLEEELRNLEKIDNLEEQLRNLGNNLKYPLKESDEEDSLKDKLLRIINTFSERLKEGVIISDEFSEYLRKQVLKEGIVDEKDILDSSHISYNIKRYLEDKLNIKKIEGLKHDYSALESTKISKKAKRDIRDLKDLNEKVDEYLKKQESKPASEEFKIFFYSILPKGMKDKRRDHFYSKFTKKYNIEKSENKDYLIKDIQKTLENINLKEI